MESNNTRRRRQPPPFSQVGVLNRVKESKVLLSGERSGVYYSKTKEMEFSPYVNYIPINYLTIRNETLTMDEEYINYDEPNYIARSSIVGTSNFEDIQRIMHVTGRTIRKITGCYSLIYENKAHILACILPENLVYQKLHILSKGTIDLSKVIVFIDSELDRTSFPVTSLRTLYRTELLPKIIETSCVVFKVPLAFIMENCFYRKDSTLPLNIQERKKVKEEMLESFRNVKRGIVVPEPSFETRTTTVSMVAPSPIPNTITVST